MNHHAYYLVGRGEEGLEAALSFGESLGLPRTSPDVLVLRPALFSVDEARRLAELVSRTPVTGDKKLVIAMAERIFHEAQNAMLKAFEEPPEGTYLVIVVPSEGVLLRTLRSRLLPLPGSAGKNAEAEAFLKGTDAVRQKMVEAILNRAKSDKPEEKQAARSAALAFAEGLLRAGYPRRAEPLMRALLEDLDRFLPILHERSAPLKLILEHLLLVTPKK